SHWVVFDSVRTQAQEFESLAELDSSSVFAPSAARADLPSMLQRAAEYIQVNKPGPTELWICSDLQSGDWRPGDGNWRLFRDTMAAMPQSVRVHLLAYPDRPAVDRGVWVQQAERTVQFRENRQEYVLKLSFRIHRTGGENYPDETIPAQLTIDGVTSELPIVLSGAVTEITQQEIPLPDHRRQGWGSIALPADECPSNDVFYFVYAEPPPRRVVLVTENAEPNRALEIAAAIAPDGITPSEVQRLRPDQVDSLELAGTAAVLWQAPLPDADTARILQRYVEQGGQLMFFPPTQLLQTDGADQGQFMGVQWRGWRSEQNALVENWRSDEDLLAATQSGMGLPLGALQIRGFATLQAGESSVPLATLGGGNPLLLKVPTTAGGVYFCTLSPDPRYSSLAENGIVLYVVLQRMIQRGQQSMQLSQQRTAGWADPTSASWRQVAGPPTALSSEFAAQPGVYQAGDRLLAINRPEEEDRWEILDDATVDPLFEGIPLDRLEQSAGSLAGIVREIWRLFLFSMIAAMLVEAILSMPRRPTSAA
ncbi:MAG: hypothetical protein D6753_08475, partial [Planctomycetota bacterium]